MSKIDDLIKELCPDGVELKRLGVVCNKIKTGGQRNKSTLSKTRSSDNQYPVINGGISESGFTNEFNTPSNTITVSQGGASSGFVNYMTENFWAGAHCYVVSPSDESYLNNRYLYFILKNSQTLLMDRAVGAGIPGLNSRALNEYKIPIPPLEAQKEIVRVLDSFTGLEAGLEAELEARKKQYEYYRNTLLTFEDDRNITCVELGKVAKYEQPTKYIVRSSDYNDDFSIPVLTAGKTFILGYTDESSGVYNASVHPVIIFDDFTTANKWVDFDFKVKSSAMKIITSVDESTALLKYIYHWLNTLPSGLVEGDHKRQWISSWSKKKIPIPPLEKQQQIVSILDKFEKLTNDISVGLPAEIEARRKQYEYYRNKLLTFKELECSR